MGIIGVVHHRAVIRQSDEIVECLKSVFVQRYTFEVDARYQDRRGFSSGKQVAIELSFDMEN